MYKAKLEMKKRVFYLIELGEEHAKIKQKVQGPDELLGLCMQEDEKNCVYIPFLFENIVF